MRCTYCFVPLDKRIKTKDHIFPRSWFPETTPPNIAKLHVPACSSCNYNLKLVEEDLFLKWGVCLDEKDPAVAGVTQKVHKSIRIDDAKNSRVRSIRSRQFLNLLNSFTKYDVQKTLKGLAPKNGVRGTLSVRIATKNSQAFGHKIVRGLEYQLRKRLTDDRIVRVHYVYDSNPKMIPYYEKWEKLISSEKKVLSIGPGFQVSYAINPSNQDQVIYSVKIWNHIEFWGLIY